MKKGTDYNVIVDIPEGAHKCKDGRVYVVLEKRYYQDLHYNMDNRAWLGKAVSDTHMHPNNIFKEMYPEKLEGVSYLNLPVYVKHMGVYAAALAIGEQTGLYADLVENLGPRSANLVMDYAAYSILTRSNSAKDFKAMMSDQMLFLEKAYSDSWMQEQFDTVITDNQLQAFKNAWLKRFSQEDISGAWLCIDGSNDNCGARIDEAEKGNAKSRKNTNIISFLYAVTDTGAPIISQVYRGSRVDCQAIKEMVAIIAEYGIKPKGIILDRAFCDESCIRLLFESGYDFVIMMKENTNGFHELLEKYQDEIKLKWKYALGHGLFGVNDKVKLFQSSNLTVNAAFIWDGKNGIDRASYLIDEVMNAVKDAVSAIENGRRPSIPEKCTAYVKIIPDGNGGLRVVVQEEVLQTEIQSKGFYGLICSRQMCAAEANAVYDLRDSSEKQYSIMKTQLGDSVFRAHNMHRIATREAIAFVASVIRQKIMRKCRDVKPAIDTNVAIKELNLITMNLIGHSQYRVIHNQSKRQKNIMERLGIGPENLDFIASYETSRLNKETVSPVHSMSSFSAPEGAGKTRKIKGTPAGSSAKVKVPKSTTLPVEDSSGTPIRSGPGRPKGSKNKPKTAPADPTAKRGRGRPKGSKNQHKR